MRTTLIGVGLAVALIGLLFWLDSTRTHPTPEQTAAQIANQINKGFVGARLVGAWQMVCLPSPMVVGNQPKSSSASPDDHASGEHGSKTQAAPPAQVSFGRCRTTMEFAPRNRPRRPIVVINFRLVGDQKQMTIIVRFAPIAHKDDVVVMAVRRGVLKIPVDGCTPAACVAVRRLSGPVETALLSSPGALLVLPAPTPQQRLRLRVPFLGLAPSLAAMRRAG